jgi:hypothetical protein
LNCPFCSFEGPPRVLHAHLGDQHPEAIRFEDRGERWFYALDCPLCGDGYEREIKPRGRDPGFVEEFSTQIRLVAFDMLVNHLLGEHEPDFLGDTPGPPGENPEDEPEPEATEVPVAGPVPSWLAEARRAKQQNGN